MRAGWIAFGVVIAAVFLMTSCGEKATPKKAPAAGKTATGAVGKTAKTPVKAAVVGTANDRIKKHNAINAAQSQIEALEAKWQELQAKAEAAGDEVKADFQKAKDQMAKALADAKAKLTEAKAAGVDTWEKSVKPALDSALQKVQQLFVDTDAKIPKK